MPTRKVIYENLKKYWNGEVSLWKALLFGYGLGFLAAIILMFIVSEGFRRTDLTRDIIGSIYLAWSSVGTFIVFRNINNTDIALFKYITLITCALFSLLIFVLSLMMILLPTKNIFNM